jgi:hypothetical protein
MTDEKFWLQDPLVLLNLCNLIPTAVMSKNERLNALTRLLLLISGGLYWLDYKQYYLVLLLGLIVIVVLHCQNNSSAEHFRPEVSEQQALQDGIRQFDPSWDSRPHGPIDNACWFDINTDMLNATYEVTPKIQFNHDEAAKRSYMNAKYELTPLTDTDGFRQIWRNEPDNCGGYSMVPDPETQFPVDNPDSRGQCNYIVRSKIDHLPVSQGQNDLISTRPIAEQAFNDSVTQFRESIMAEHIDRFRRERQHNCPDMKLGSSSAGSGGTI